MDQSCTGCLGHETAAPRRSRSDPRPTRRSPQNTCKLRRVACGTPELDAASKSPGRKFRHDLNDPQHFGEPHARSTGSPLAARFPAERFSLQDAESCARVCACKRTDFIRPLQPHRAKTHMRGSERAREGALAKRDHRVAPTLPIDAPLGNAVLTRSRRSSRHSSSGSGREGRAQTPPCGSR